MATSLVTGPTRMLALGFVSAFALIQSTAAQPFGGVVGVLQSHSALSQPVPRPRAMTAEMAELIDKPVINDPSLIGTVTLRMNHADLRYQVGDSAWVFVETSRRAYLQLLTVAQDGSSEFLLPADKLLSGQAQLVEPGHTEKLPPLNAGIAYKMAPPAAPSVLYAIASSEELPPHARAELVTALAKAGKAPNAESTRDVIARFAAATPDWHMATTALAYEIVTATPPPPPPAPTPAPKPSPFVQPSGPQLPWLHRPQPGTSAAPMIAVHLSSQSYAAGAPVTLLVHTSVGCVLNVLVLGSGGQVDTIYPNLRQTRTELAAGTEIAIPPANSDLVLRTRGAPGRQSAQERIVAVCLPLDAPRLSSRTPSEAAPTLTFSPDSPEVLALAALGNRASSIALAASDYTVGAAVVP